MAHYEVHHANCFEWLREQQTPLSIHAVCTDPPFGIVEFLPHEMVKLRNGRGGVWRIPPTIGGSQRAPLPRFTTLNQQEREHVRVYFREFGEALMPALIPGAHVFLAGTPMLQHLVQSGMAEAGYEVRGAIMRLYRGFRGGDRPKLAEQEFANVCVTPRGAYEPWMLFRKPIAEKTVAQNLRKWGTGALRRLSVDQPLPDIIQSGKTPIIEEAVSDHPTLKPQHLLRILTRSLLPLGKGQVLDPFCGSGSTLAACQAVGYDAIGIEVDDDYFASLHTNIRQLSGLYPKYRGETLEMLSDGVPVANGKERRQGVLL
ncbi:MAG: site-specific DNA-methyltransferase [Gammaproteobacteria bacterium]|nr:site-specific DNA-methyltransferase [Gammaproteobacteria bacterium]MBU1722240.1 site-specific DNA-methyltransferase [Gammaproteobacteria bacterium]MBU2005347.1 site-specific DNA-methyltransferase [Gammaproteobacteria bacterium]